MTCHSEYLTVGDHNALRGRENEQVKYCERGVFRWLGLIYSSIRMEEGEGFSHSRGKFLLIAASRFTIELGLIDSGDSIAGKLPFSIKIHCHLFVKANADEEEEWYSEQAKKLVALHLGYLCFLFFFISSCLEQ